MQGGARRETAVLAGREAGRQFLQRWVRSGSDVYCTQPLILGDCGGKAHTATAPAPAASVQGGKIDVSRLHYVDGVGLDRARASCLTSVPSRKTRTRGLSLHEQT